jgi:3-hydroxyacyl-CoA dehydrogenase
MKHRIEKAAVLGAGTMGARIAAHLANAGIPCFLLDIAPKELNEGQKRKGLTLENPAVRRRPRNRAPPRSSRRNQHVW